MPQGTRQMALRAADWRLLLTVALAQVMIAAALRVMPPSALCAGTARFRRLAQLVGHGSQERIIVGHRRDGAEARQRRADEERYGNRPHPRSVHSVV